MRLNPEALGRNSDRIAVKSDQRTPVGADREAGHGPRDRLQIPGQSTDVGKDRRGVAFIDFIDRQSSATELLDRQVHLELFDL